MPVGTALSFCEPEQGTSRISICLCSSVNRLTTRLKTMTDGGKSLSESKKTVEGSGLK